MACNDSKSTPSNNNNGSQKEINNESIISMEFNPDYNFIYTKSHVKDLNFYWTTLVENDTDANSLIMSDKSLSSSLQKIKDKFNNININTLSTSEFSSKLKFTNNEKNEILKAIKNAISKSNKFDNIDKKHISQSGVFNKFSNVKYSYRINQLIVEQLIDGINGIIETYGEGIDPTYPKIDKISYNVNSSEYKQLVTNLFNEIKSNLNSYTLFYQPCLEFALGLLKINHRDEAGRHTPMRNDVNRALYDNLSQINWSKYTYSLILVLGDAPNSAGDLPNISVGGMQRCDHAVELYKKGIAPIIALSGGCIAPFQTKYAEAIEMKKYIMNKYNIPEKYILCEPHARHTTTNIRNTGRLMFKYKIPTNKKAIVSTSKTHSDYIFSEKYLNRCQKELQYLPAKFFNRISEFDVEFSPNINVLYLDSNDPLDP